jgi:hypothetical protein
MRNCVVLPAYELAIFDIADFPTQLQPMIQAGYLETEFDEFLVGTNGYWEAVDGDTFAEKVFEKNRGVTITRTRPGLKAPVVVAIDPAAAQTGPNDGISPSDFYIEQYTFAPQEFGDGIDLDLIGTNFGIVDRFEHDVKASNKQAIQSVDLLARDTYLLGYGTGATVALAAVSGGTVHVDDIRGLATVITVGPGGTNGLITAVSVGTPLPAVIYVGGSGTNQKTCNITAAVPDVTNISNYVPYGLPYGAPGAPTNARANGISGTLTVANVQSGYAIAQGDIIVAGDAPMQLISGGGVHFSQLQGGDGLTSALLLDAVGNGQNNAVPFAMNRDSEDEGTYIAHIAPSIMRSLFNDDDFKQANQTLGQSKVYKKGKVSQYLGVTFLENTNAPRIPLKLYGGTGYAYPTIVTGQGALIDTWYEGLEDWVNNGLNPGYVVLDRGIAQILMPAYADRHGRRVKIDWLTIRDMVCPTDVTRASSVLTGTGARRARATVIWTWSAT